MIGDIHCVECRDRSLSLSRLSFPWGFYAAFPTSFLLFGVQICMICGSKLSPSLRALQSPPHGARSPKPLNPRLHSKPEQLETGLRAISAGIPYTSLLRIEAIGFPTFGLLL